MGKKSISALGEVSFKQQELLNAITLCDITKAYTDIYVNTQQLLFNTTSFYT